MVRKTQWEVERVDGLKEACFRMGVGRLKEGLKMKARAETGDETGFQQKGEGSGGEAGPEDKRRWAEKQS